MQEVTWNEWCQIKKQREKELEESSKHLSVGKCSCGNFYSWNTERDLDPGKCIECRFGGEG